MCCLLFSCCCSPSCCWLSAMTYSGLSGAACMHAQLATWHDEEAPCPALPCPACPPAQGRAIFADRLTSGDVALPNGETRHLRAIDPVYVFPGKLDGCVPLTQAAGHVLAMYWPCAQGLHRRVPPLVSHARVSWALHLVLPALPTRCAALLTMQAWPWVSPCRGPPACVRTCSLMPPRRWRAGEGGRALGVIMAPCAS